MYKKVNYWLNQQLTKIKYYKVGWACVKSAGIILTFYELWYNYLFMWFWQKHI